MQIAWPWCIALPRKSGHCLKEIIPRCDVRQESQAFLATHLFPPAAAELEKPLVPNGRLAAEILRRAQVLGNAQCLAIKSSKAKQRRLGGRVTA
jgi:hypothetical protein